MNEIKIKVDMRCEKAARDHNEDDCCLIANLADGQPGFSPDKEIVLDDKGALLVVCDGMGGMNAGETASKIAVETIREWFMPDKLTAEMMSKPELVKQHIVNAIVDADNRIKKEGESDREKEGMGSTVVLAWITGTRAYISWCGDSRAYCFNTADGLKQLSHDHSYVQELVDSGLLSEDLAFDHPQNNIITRNLGDPNGDACPDIKDYELRDGDLIMLCSDGLCGVLRDSEIETVMRRNTGSVRSCRDALWDAARNAGWHDNVTVELCQILSGCPQTTAKLSDKRQTGKLSVSKWLLIVIFLAGMIAGYLLCIGVTSCRSSQKTEVRQKDSVQKETLREDSVQEKTMQEDSVREEI